MTEPQVSYIVTVFNKRAFLTHVIAALKAQAGDFTREFIFVDDGSTDDSSALIRAAFGDDERLKLISQPNQGPTAATNAGIAAATGDWIKPVDGDDILAPGMTRTLLEAVQKTGCAVAFAPTRRAGLYSPETPVDGILASFDPAISSVERIDLLAISLRNAQTNPTAWLASRDLVNAVGGCDPAFFIQDYSIELRLAAAGPVAKVDIEPFKAPADPTGRAHANEAQILHDMNGALANFLYEYSNRLPAELVRLGLRRATGRAWLWARRHGDGFMTREGVDFLCARLGVLRANATLCDRVCRTFRQTGSVRIPQPVAQQTAEARHSTPAHRP